MSTNRILETLETVRRDSLTNDEYTFVASPPPDVLSTSLAGGINARAFTLIFFWHTVAAVRNTEHGLLMQKQAEELLPILQTIVSDIKVDAFFKQPSEELIMSYRLDYVEDIPATDEAGADITIRVSRKVMEQYADEVKDSEVMRLCMALFYRSNRDLLEQTARASLSKPTPEPETEATKKKRQAEFSTELSMMSLHAASQFFHIPLEDAGAVSTALEMWRHKTGEQPANKIVRYGVDLTEIQMRVMKGIIDRFSDVRYMGDLPAKEKSDIVAQYPAINDLNGLPKIYKNIKEIPTLKIKRRELVRLAGMNYDNQREATRVAEALEFLGATQFCYLYSRLATNEEGKPERDSKTGNNKKELVSGVDTLFKVKNVIDPETGALSYYEVSPSMLFLDQKESYYMLIPKNWQQEVKKLLGPKKVTNYTFVFLLWLRYKFEMIRRKNKAAKVKAPYEIPMSWVMVAKAIRMPESVYLRQKARALKIVEDSYAAAKELGYLIDYSRTEKKDTLILNPDKYHRPNSELGG